MKRTLVLTMGLLLTAGLASAQTGIASSGHDFSGNGWANNEICLPCHTPHNAIDTGSGALAPLWNHAETTQTFTPYTSPTNTLDATVGAPAGISKLCLSCHDGVTALDSFGGVTGATLLAGDAAFGTDLSNDHPVSFTYDTALATADGELRDPATYTTILGGLLEDDFLFAGEMECASCHDVHDGADLPNMLITSNGGSVLCLTCHVK